MKLSGRALRLIRIFEFTVLCLQHKNYVLIDKILEERDTALEVSCAKETKYL